MKTTFATVALGAALLASAAFAQSSPGTTAGGTSPAIQSGIEKNPGLGQDKPKERTSVGESNAVGSLGTGADQKSMPPAMEKDCARNPAECSEPLTTGTTATPGMPQQSK